MSVLRLCDGKYRYLQPTSGKHMFFATHDAGRQATFLNAALDYGTRSRFYALSAVIPAVAEENNGTRFRYDSCLETSPDCPRSAHDRGQIRSTANHTLRRLPFLQRRVGPLQMVDSSTSLSLKHSPKNMSIKTPNQDMNYLSNSYATCCRARAIDCGGRLIL